MSSKGKQWKVIGRKNPGRTRRKENVYFDCGDYMEIHIQCKGQTVVAKFDKSDLRWIEAFTWNARYDQTLPGFYIESSIVGQVTRNVSVKMHRLIMQEPKGMVVDHINHDTTDNRKKNLRVITNAQNCQNKKGAMSTNQCGILGVRRRKNMSKWEARITVNKKQIYLGAFEDIKDAERAVVEARAKYMPYSKEALA